MSDIQEASSLTLKNGITYLLKDAKAREQIANLLSNLLVEYGEGNVPPLGKVAVEDVVPISEGGTEATTAAQAAKNLGVLPLGEVTTKIPSGANLNDYVFPGVYAIISNNTAATIANLPVQLAGTVRVFASAGNAITASSAWKYLIQEYITFTGVRYQRFGESGSGTAVTWRAWVTIYTSANFENPPIRYVDKSDISVTISSNGGFQSLGTFTSLGVPTGATVVSFFIKGWSGANGVPVLLASSDATTLYCMMSDAPSSATINIRIFYEL